jgi:hypothetical protein
MPATTILFRLKEHRRVNEGSGSGSDSDDDDTIVLYSRVRRITHLAAIFSRHGYITVKH